jgi:hypothetical protein
VARTDSIPDSYLALVETASVVVVGRNIHFTLALFFVPDSSWLAFAYPANRMTVSILAFVQIPLPWFPVFRPVVLNNARQAHPRFSLQYRHVSGTSTLWNVVAVATQRAWFACPMSYRAKLLVCFLRLLAHRTIYKTDTVRSPRLTSERRLARIQSKRSPGGLMIIFWLNFACHPKLFASVSAPHDL